MLPFARFMFAAVAALGFLAISPRPAHAGPIYLDVEMHSPFPSYESPDSWAVYLHLVVGIDPGWYLDGLSFTGTADQAGHSLDWWDIPRGSLSEQLIYLSSTNFGGSAIGYCASAYIDANTQPGIYNRNPSNLKSSATFTVYARNDEGEVASESVSVGFRVPGPIVPEPASALLLSVGLMVPGGAVWLRRRRAA